jgi:hypothetical protein
LGSAKNNIHNIYKMNIFNNINKLIPKQLYSTSRHNVLALVFVLLVILVVQYPAIFSKSANTSFGKAIILLIIILLTNYNTLVGLAATIVVVVFYVYLFDTGYEGLENMDAPSDKPQENTPKPDAASNSAINGVSSTPSALETSANSLIEASAPPAIAAPAVPIPTATPVATPQEVSQSEKMYSGQIPMTPQDSNTIPYTPMQNPDVQPSESTGNAKSTSDATTLKPTAV